MMYNNKNDDDDDDSIHDTMEYSPSTPLYSPHSPDYCPLSGTATPQPQTSLVDSGSTTCVYGEKFEDLARLTCRPVAQRNILVDQLIFRSLNTSGVVIAASANDNSSVNEDFPESISGGSVGLPECGGDDNLRTIAGSSTPGKQTIESFLSQTAASSEVVATEYKSNASLILIPSTTARVYSSFVINRHKIPKLCVVCLRDYCICGKTGIDNVTTRHYNPRSYDFFRPTPATTTTTTTTATMQ